MAEQAGRTTPVLSEATGSDGRARVIIENVTPDQYLMHFPAYFQQGDMESNGKSCRS